MKYKILCSCSIFIFLISCATVQGGKSSMENQEFNDEFISLVHSLIDDALDLLPDNLSSAIASEGSLDGIMDGVFKYSSSNPLNHSTNPDNLGIQAAYIASRIYGDTPLEDIHIPQVIYYGGFSSTDINNIEIKIRGGKYELTKSNNIDRDRYNLALGLLVDLWLNNFIKSGITVSKIPQEGLYLRDSEGTLYSYERREK